MTTSLRVTLRIWILLILPFLLASPAAEASRVVPVPDEDHSWPLSVFAKLESFSVRYREFFATHFGGAAVEKLPTWLELDVDTLSPGDHLLTRRVVVEENDDEILKKLLQLVSLNNEIGLTQFVSNPEFPPESFVLGHREGSLTLVAYDARGAHDPLQDLEVIQYLKKRGAFLTEQDDSKDFVVVSRGDPEQVDLWYPRLAKEVLHTHTIPGNINPTGYLDFFEGSDRDLSISRAKYRGPIRRYLLTPR